MYQVQEHDDTFFLNCTKLLNQPNENIIAKLTFKKNKKKNKPLLIYLN
jgi:hypothetical protein